MSKNPPYMPPDFYGIKYLSKRRGFPELFEAKRLN
jgi:hypothetical protein